MLNRNLKKIDKNNKAAVREEFLFLMETAREADRREGILFRQGKGIFHLPGAGHEAVAAISYVLEPKDYLYPYYRDRALMLARGASVFDLALGYFGKADSSSAGRQMSSHYSSTEHKAMSCATPTALQCLPAAGTAWACKMDGNNSIVICCIGDASVRQGEFFEAFSFAVEEKLPIIYVVEDNGYGISTATENSNPLSLKILSEEHVQIVDGRDPEKIYAAALLASNKARQGIGPTVLWLKLDRLMSHTSSDDHKLYRSKQELELIEGRDPIKTYKKSLISQGIITEEYWETKKQSVVEFIRAEYERALACPDPDPTKIQEEIFSNRIPPHPVSCKLPYGEEISMVTAINTALKQMLSANNKVVLFGQDIEDPKGGVFGLTKGLSKEFPNRVKNSPLAEATICGTASGLAVAGYVPIFELQFIDFVGTAFNQIVNQIATLRWRTNGEQNCPMVMIAPCGGYVSGGPWHSQTNESWFAHAPGIKVMMPSNAQDAADLICTSASGNDPVLILLPKNLFRKKFKIDQAHQLYPEKARVVKEGKDLTIVSWGNMVELTSNAIHSISQEINLSIEHIDLKCIVPLDLETVKRSTEKTGRLVVVQEDNRTCSIGQALISEVISDRKCWHNLISPPVLVTREDVHIGFNPILEKAVLPCEELIIEAIAQVV